MKSNLTSTKWLLIWRFHDASPMHQIIADLMHSLIDFIVAVDNERG